MRVRVLGGFMVEGVADGDLGSRKARTLLKLLAVRRGSPVAIDTIAEVLWGDDQPSRPGEQVGVLVSRLRAVLGAERIRRTDAGYVLVADWIDVDELASLATAASRALNERRIGAARAAADAALAIARGPLLGDEDGLWIDSERAAVSATVTAVRRVAIDAAVAANDHTAAVALGEQLLASDPYDEVVLRAVMRAHLAVRRPAAALAVYARVRERLADDLGVPPTAETEALHATALAAADGDRAGAVVPARAVEQYDAGLVGRDRELAALDNAFDRAAAGASVLVVVEGEAGMGKSRLVETWANRVADTALVLRGRGDELGRDLPLQPIADALSDHLRSLGPDGAAAILGDDAPALAPLLGPLAHSPATAVADAEQGRLRVFAALLATIGRAAAERPTVILVDDLHFTGPSTTAWLAFAHRRASRTVIVTTTRPRGVHSQPAEAFHVAVGPLELDAVTQLVGAERAADLYERSGGHPLLLAAFAEAPDARQRPVTVGDAVAVQLGAIDPGAARTVRLAAILGGECDIDLVAEIAGVSAVDAVTHLEHAARTGLIVERGGRFVFRHELVREAVTAMTGEAHRSAVHRQAAQILARRPSPDPLTVAIHARAGGDDALASRSFVDAAEMAAARFDLEAAEAHLAAAIDTLPTARSYVVRARVRMSRLALEDAARDAAQAVAMGGGAAALEVSGWVAYYRRRYGEAQMCADEAIAEAGRDTPLGVSALALAGRVRHGAGDLRGAVEHLAITGTAPLSVRGVADVWLAQVRLHQGRPADALAALARPLVAPDSLAHPWAPLHLRFCRSVALGQQGRVADALSVAEELCDVAAREGEVGARFVAVGANAVAWILRWSGRGDEADERNWKAYEATGGRSGPAGEGLAEGHYVSLLDLADGAVLREDHAGAGDLAQKLAAVDDWDGTMAWHQRHRLGLLRSRLALADGNRDEATGLALAVATDAASRGAARYELLAFAAAALADPSIPDTQLAPVIDGLARCAALDGWPVVAALGRARKVDAWCREAERRAAEVVKASGDAGDAARRLADRLLTG